MLAAIWFAACGVAAKAAPIRDCADCPPLIQVPAGSFVMGGATKTPNARAKDAPLHHVTIAKAFYLGATEVTRDQFTAFVRATGYRTKRDCTEYVPEFRAFAKVAQGDWRNPGFRQAGDHPVVCVDWNDALAYAGWLSVRTGKRYRLPTEAEWEYAARAGSVAQRYWGDQDESACQYANVAERNWRQRFGSEVEGVFPCSDPYPTTAPVGSFKPNSFALVDMIGNVWEWTQDCFTPSYEGAPSNGQAWEAGDCSRRIARGGSWTSPPRHVNASFRDPNPLNYRSSYLGLRVARDN